MHRGQTLLNHLDSEEKKKIEASREFKMPKYRTGDVMEMTLFQSLSEGKFNTIKGVVFSKMQPNNLRQSFKINSIIDDTNTSILVPVFSPMLAKCDVVSYGSNQNRKKMNYIPDLDLSKNRLHEPVIKGKGYKGRDQMADNKQETKVHDPT